MQISLFSLDKRIHRKVTDLVIKMNTNYFTGFIVVSSFLLKSVCILWRYATVALLLLASLNLPIQMCKESIRRRIGVQKFRKSYQLSPVAAQYSRLVRKGLEFLSHLALNTESRRGFTSSWTHIFQPSIVAYFATVTYRTLTLQPVYDLHIRVPVFILLRTNTVQSITLKSTVNYFGWKGIDIEPQMLYDFAYIRSNLKIRNFSQFLSQNLEKLWWNVLVNSEQVSCITKNTQ